MKLPAIPKSSLDVRPIDWTGLEKRYMNPGELEVLCALVRSVCPERVLEIGCNAGRTAKALLREVPTILDYLGIDVPPGYVFAKRVQHREVPARPGMYAQDDPRFSLLLSPRGSMDLIADDLPRMDAIFIDGDHGRAAVEHDTQLARRIVRPGGIIVWHDYHDLGTVDVRDVLDDLFAGGDPIERVEGTWLAFQRIPK